MPSKGILSLTFIWFDDDLKKYHVTAAGAAASPGLVTTEVSTVSGAAVRRHRRTRARRTRIPCGRRRRLQQFGGMPTRMEEV
jgi:hypothetical protein